MLAPAYFSPNYKYFDQLLQTVKNKTTVLILVFKELLQTSIPPLISVLYAKGYHDFLLKKFRLTVPKNFVEEPVYVSENFGYRKMLGINRKNFWQGNDTNPEPTAWEPCCPKPTAVICFWIKRAGNFSLKKKEKRPYWMNNFSCILHILRKIIKRKIKQERSQLAQPIKLKIIVCKVWLCGKN